MEEHSSNGHSQPSRTEATHLQSPQEPKDHGKLGYVMGLGFIFLVFMSLFLCGLFASATLHFMGR